MSRLTQCGALIFSSLLLLGGWAHAEPSSEISNRIYGGAKSSITKRVGLLVESQRGTSLVYFCSGVFLSSTHFLTAKHCLARNGFKKPVFSIYHSLRARPIKVTAKVKSATDDIALLTVPSTSIAEPLPILVSRTPSTSEIVKIFGYGKDQKEKSALDPGTRHFLKVGNVALTDITSKLFSFRNSSTGGVCHGDSGGPMVAAGDLNGDPSDVGIIGIASFFRGPDRCRAGNDGFYVNVQSTNALSFILSHAPEALTN